MAAPLVLDAFTLRKPDQGRSPTITHLIEAASDCEADIAWPNVSQAFVIVPKERCAEMETVSCDR
jgi:hypothetical protein